MKDYLAHAATRLISLIFLAQIVFAAAPLSAADLRLVLFEQPGCAWCERWNREIGPIYPKTPEAKAAPLMRLQLSEALPENVRLSRPARFTPTFVLISDGDEVGRIEGYPGEDFFWPLLDDLIAQAGVTPTN